MINTDKFISELIRKNEKALDYLYDNYLGLAYKIALNLLNDVASKEDIEECVSDIFIGVWNNIHKFNPEITTFKKWFIAVSKYKAIDYRRKCKSKYESVEVREDSLLEPRRTEEGLILEEDIKVLMDLIENMKEKDRVIFIKRFIEGNSITSISRELGLERTVIDNRISRGRKSLKNKWMEIMGR